MITIAVMLGTCVLAPLTVITVRLIDTPRAKARAAVEARSYEPRPRRRRIPRSATFIVQTRHVTDPDPTQAAATNGSTPEEVVLVEANLLARTEVWS